jgi:hypothetical protein
MAPSVKKKKKLPPRLETRLAELEENAARQGIHIHYDLLEAAGLKLKGGICKLNGEYHIFVDRRKPITEKIDFLESYLDHPLPDDIPSNP